ncbi:MAG: N-acetylglucosamine-6-phosphate deacetylase, partial [Olegusella sp.]|nr:N-acetylglucosamine-6-phosphate deacetylase [Olegusella sp.]
MATFALHADRFVLPGRVAGPGYLPIVDGRFGFFTSERPDCEVVEAPGSWVAPGLVDSHIHGFYGHATT